MVDTRAGLRIHGRVQGVCYRMETRDQADKLGLTGWVANRRDGTVELVAEGEKAVIEQLIEWCKKGPALAKVSKIDVQWGEPGGEYEDFGIRYTF